MLSALRNFAITFVISAIIFGILAWVAVGFIFDTVSTPTINPDDPDVTNNIPPQTGSNVTPPNDTETDETTPPEDEINGETFNILLIGSDYQPKQFDDYNYEEEWYKDPSHTGFPDKRDRAWGADALVLVRVDKEARKFIFCAIPRNTKVLVNGETTQLGDTLSEKGVDYLCQKVTGLTGLEVNYYVHMNVEAIPTVVDAAGSITYNVPEDMKYEDPDQDLVIDLKKGATTLDGKKAEQLLRYVGYKSGNAGRMNTAIEFLKAAFAKFTDPTYMVKAPGIYDAIAKNTETNFTSDDLANNIDLLFSYPEFEAITVAYPGSTRTSDGIAYFEPSLTAALNMFDSFSQ